MTNEEDLAICQSNLINKETIADHIMMFFFVTKRLNKVSIRKSAFELLAGRIVVREYDRH